MVGEEINKELFNIDNKACFDCGSCHQLLALNGLMITSYISL